MRPKYHEIKEFKERYDYLKFYSKLFNGNLKENKFPWFKTFCPFHTDRTTPNFFVNTINGVYHCFACGKSGHYYDFIVDGNSVRLLENLNDTILRERIENHKDAKLTDIDLAIEDVRATEAHRMLLSQPFSIQTLRMKRGLTIETIKEYKLGFANGTFTFPIYDQTGNLASFKHHKKYQTKGAKNQIYPWKAVLRNTNTYVIICEGEFDALLLRQMGFNACTQIFGANSWDTAFNYYFRRKTVYLAYDNDEAGITGAMAVGASLWASKTNVKVIEWPHFMQDGQDHIDYFVVHKQPREAYITLMTNAVNIMYKIHKK